MIRFLGLLLIFAVGLAAAAVWYGQMHHLRRAVPDGLPVWAAEISDTSGLRQGQMLRAAQGVLPAVLLTWTARPPTAEGLLWDVQLTGEGIDIQAELLLAYWPDKMLIRNGAGTVALAKLPGSNAEGLVTLTALTGEVADLFGTAQPSGTLTAEAKGIAVDGTRLGAGPITGAIDASGVWQAEVALAGGVSAIDGRISGALPGTDAVLEVTIADASALPAATQQALSRFGTAQGAGLRLTLPFSLGN